MDIEPRAVPPDPVPTDAEREAAAAVLRDAVGSGLLTLDEFSDRVGVVWAAERHDEIERATAGLAPTPVVGTRTVSTVVAVLGDQRHGGRLRLPGLLRVFSLLGDVHLDIGAVVSVEETIEIQVWSLAGDLHVRVPDGFEVEVAGFNLLGDREVRLAPVPVISGAPLIRITVYGLLGDVSVRSASEGARVPGWRRWLLGHQPPPPPPPPSGGFR